MSLPPAFKIDPPLLNSAGPWATDEDELRILYDCPYTGAVTTRTSLAGGFGHDPTVHQYIFFDPITHEAKKAPFDRAAASLNSLGYSPLPLGEYLDMIKRIVASTENPKKGFIISVTGDSEEITDCFFELTRFLKKENNFPVPLALEINLSCPNIPHMPPPGYSEDGICEYIELGAVQACDEDWDGTKPVPVGLKIPPYTHSSQYDALIDTLHIAARQREDETSHISFITTTNTLGSCLVLDPDDKPQLPGFGIGGMGGAPLHPLALGNVATIRRMLDEYPKELGHIQVIGVGGVSDAAGYERMKAAGAYAVGVGTALGMRGVKVFEEMAKSVGDETEVGSESEDATLGDRSSK